ncbi:MAG: HlyD family efflux transporter periplasmic adaptor subunit [Pirellulaceae bacterium]|nr:HlyD family efflux transporter periplasmic adaptor subunit [Pirellulaceae bacterium]
MSTALESTNTRPVKLKMRGDLTAHRQIYQGQVFWVIKEPVGLSYYRFPEDSYFVMQQLDGQHNLEQIEAAYNAEFSPRRLTIDKLQSFIGSLHKAGLLQAVSTGQGQELLKRRQKLRRQKLFSQWGNVLALRFRGIDPERILNNMNPSFGWIFSAPAVCFVMFCGFLALMSIFVNWELFLSRLPTFNQFFDPISWVLLGVVLAFTKVLHEFGHGLSCKRFGGECHEMGFMLLVLTPCLYCNVSDSWTLPNKWHRAAIGAAGIYIELILATIATAVWWHTAPGMLNQLALQMMTICSVSTVLFNGNPLLRFDGYYILADVMEVPNLQQKSTQALTNLCKKHLLGIENVNEQMMPTRNMPMFALYAIASIIYRWFIVIVILVFLNKLFEPYGLQVLGQMIAAMSLGTLIGMPLYKLYKFLKNPGQRYQIKMKRALISGAVITTVVGIVLSIPLPYHVYCDFTVRGKGSENVYVQTPGSVKAVLVTTDQAVEEGQQIIQLENLQLQENLVEIQSQLLVLEAQARTLELRAFRNTALNEQLVILQSQIQGEKKREADMLQRIERLTLKAPRQGFLMPVVEQQSGETEMSLPMAAFESKNYEGWLPASMPVCAVGDPDQLEAVMAIPEERVSFIQAGMEVKIKPFAYSSQTIDTTIYRVGKQAIPPPQADAPQTGFGAMAQAAMASPSNQYYATAELGDGQGVTLKVGSMGRAKIRAGSRSLFSRISRWAADTFRFQ